MENTERGQPSIDGDTFPSSDVESEESTDTELTTSIDTAQPEAGKFFLTKPANEKVVQTELNGQTSNEASQTEQGTEIPVKENSTLTKGEEIKLSIQDYLDPDDTKKSKFNAYYYRMVRQNPFRGSLPEHPQDHIETLEELIPDEYDRFKLFSFSLEGEALRWLNCLATGSLTCWEEIRKIKNSLKSLHSFLQNKHRSDIAQIDDNALSDTDNYLDEGTNCSDPYSVLHVDSFTQAYDIAVKSCTGRERFNIRQALTGNRKTKSEFYGKINMVYGELMEKSDSLGELIRKLEGQVAEIATAIKRDAGCLPGRTDLNPRRQVSAVMLRIRKNLAADTRNNTDVGKPDDTDKTGKSNSHPILLNDLDPNPSQENRKTTAEKAKKKAIDLELEEDTEIEDEIDR
ncbi:hypothetical protein IGI04_014754 [Brassica rapa subsp. trilocularis]|uniref:Retrotransposon gag domain-containing protein n=1 Tax=Brassica rapa subsp. trilocularis TaxID=1813537 RepID=A0ABQ7MN66_BRACM|nr:hypothetical protein IGI04_014754 [Brassica rapa subsp. trilocularis]